MKSSDIVMEKANYWATSEAFDQKTRREISSLLECRDSAELTDRFYRDLSFGTGGMRGIMGAGSCRMNIYNIRKATTAFALYLKESGFRASGSRLRVAISFDSRNGSHEFARHAAEVLAAHAIEAIITREMRPVPVLSYMVRKYHCAGGICITASHNPPVYNGFKVYWHDGGQLTPPHDQNIIGFYKNIKGYDGLHFIPWAEGVSKGLIREVLEELDESYHEEVNALSLNPEGRRGFKIVYSPIHGTGIFAVPRALKSFGFDHILIPPAQRDPDGDFPTVSSPNPEDPEALQMALQLGKDEGADLVLATDPDTDRIACIVNEKGTFVNFNGNQLICLLTDYILRSLQQQKRLPENALVISTIVTSPLHQKIAEHYGAACDITLTGFKWICQKIEEYTKLPPQEQKSFICGGEESYGFLYGSFVRDKDAVSSCAMAAEMVAWYRHKGMTLSGVLEEIYARHGVYCDSLYNLVLPGKKGAVRFEAIMNHFRAARPVSIAGYRVLKICDIGENHIIEPIDGRWQTTGECGLPRSNVLQFELEAGIRFSVRPSGTEPKIKFYFSVFKDTKGCRREDISAVKLAAERLLKEVEEKVISEAEHIQG